MKVCLFSDIHGNGPAFFSAYPRILSEDADLNLYLGDLCGYYYDQVEIFSALCEMPNLVCLKGNHDLIFAKLAKGDNGLRMEYLERYGRSMENLLEYGTDDFEAWLDGLPLFYRDPGGKFISYHGSPSDFSQGYVYPDSDLNVFRQISEPFVFLGHTHYKMHRRSGKTRFINPGSLGQPRGGSWPTYAVVDLVSGEVIFHEIHYNKDDLRKKIDLQGDENEFLRAVLYR